MCSDHAVTAIVASGLRTAELSAAVDVVGPRDAAVDGGHRASEGHPGVIGHQLADEDGFEVR